MDICGLVTLTVMGGYKYFIIFIDEFFCYIIVELILGKLDFLEAFRYFKAKVELQRGKRIKMVHSNCVSEY